MGNGSINLFQFKLLRVVGRGSFGKVRMVERRETGKVYALKYISKAQVIKMDAVKNVLREREILETLDHAFVVNMRFAFQDDEYMYMCMDLMMGGDLRFHLNRKTFGEDVVRFWIAELCSAVAHLHSQGIVHRDIKPDNVLLDEKGHAHLTDFNISCKLTPEKPYLTSQSGTVAYMAPEVFRATGGYGTSVDWWAIGVVFYECIYGKRPFQTDSLNDLKRAIPSQPIEYPEKEGVSRECISAMQGFLTRDIRERLGIKGGMDAVRQHPFFLAGAYQTNPENWWFMLESKQVTPKFQPSSEHNNFDATFDLEELLLDDEPLTYRSTRKRAQRMQKEKQKAMKEENARAKAEYEAAAQAAELAMSASKEGYYNQGDNYNQQQGINYSNSYSGPNNNYNNSPNGRPGLPHMLPRSESAGPLGDRKLNQKRSKLYLNNNNASSDSNSSSNNSSHIHLTSAPTDSMPGSSQYQHSLQHPSTRSDPNMSRPMPPLPPLPPPLKFPAPPPPSAIRQSRNQPNMFTNGRHLASLPPPPTQGLPAQPGTTTRSSHDNKPVQGYGYTTITAEAGRGQGVTPIYLSKPASSDAPSSYGGATFMKPGMRSQHRDDDPNTNPAAMASFHQLHQTPRAAPQKHIPLIHNNQQQQPVYLHHQQVPSRQVSPGPQGPNSISPAAANIAAASAAAKEAALAAMASGNMSKKDRVAYQMALIDREFTTFDYTVFEDYNGLIDPSTMSVGDPPEWVRSRDHQR
ncbi:AGC/YANK protein kinase [Podila verticillata NRRL 6337]|nr:AGC/YANK protein kinase [Podila verticillata NRRL 6337]